MKKFLTLIGAMSLVTGSAMSVIACDTNLEPASDAPKADNLEDQIVFKNVFVVEPTTDQILTALKIVNPNLVTTNLRVTINDASTATVRLEEQTVEITYKVQQAWQDLNEVIKVKTIMTSGLSDAEILDALIKANPDLNRDQLRVALLENNSEALIFASQNSPVYLGEATIKLEVIDNSVDLATVISNNPVELFAPTQQEAMKAIAKANPELIQSEIELEVVSDPLVIRISAKNNSTKYHGTVELPYTINQTAPLVLDEIINDQPISVFDDDAQTLLFNLISKNPELDVDYLKVTVNEASKFAIISPTDINPNKYSGSKIVHYNLKLNTYNLNYLNLDKDYSDKQLYVESVEIENANKVFDYYTRANSNAAKSPYQKELINFFYTYYLKSLSLQMIFFQKNYLNVQKIGDEFIPTKFKTNFVEGDNFWGRLVVLNSKAKKFVENNEAAVEAYVQPYIREDLNKIFQQVDNKLLENILKKPLYPLYSYHFIQSDNDELSDAEIEHELTNLIIRETGLDQIRINQDFTIGEIKRDKQTGKLLGQLVQVIATNDSKFLKGHFLFTINKDLTYVYDAMDWSGEEQFLNNKLLILNEINRWTSNENVKQINHYTIELNEKNNWVLKFNENSQIMSGRQTSFEIFEPNNNPSIDQQEMHINLDQTNETLTDAGLKIQINDFLKEQMKLDLVADTDWEIQGEVQRDPETSKLVGQKITIVAKNDSSLIQGNMYLFLKKDFSYLHDSMDWSNEENLFKNKLIAIDEINRWSRDLLNGYDYYFEPNEDGILTLKFNPASFIIGGDDLVFNFNQK